MTMNTNLLSEIVSAAALKLHEQCLDQYGSLYVVGNPKAAVSLPGAPMSTALDLFGLDLSPLGQALHETEVFSDLFPRVFNKFLESQKRKAGIDPRKDLIEFCMSVAPGLPVHVPPKASAVVALIQIMVAMHWAGNPGKVGKGNVSVSVGGKTYTVFRDALQWPGGYKRLSKAIGMSLPECLRQPMGTSKRSSGKVGSLYRHILKCFPEQTAAIDVVFAAAIMADCGSMLTEKFDIRLMSPEELKELRGANPYEKACELIKRASQLPYDQLLHTLAAVMSLEDFQDIFGDRPNRASSYLNDAKDRHQAQVLAMEMTHARKHKAGPNPETTQSNELVTMMRAIR